jgi:phosphomannomutase
VRGQPTESAVAGLLDRIANAPPEHVLGRRVHGVVDYRHGAEARAPWLGAAPLIELELDAGRLLVRPSGTEPKLKLYVDLCARVAAGQNPPDLERAAAELARDFGEKLELSR